MEAGSSLFWQRHRPFYHSATLGLRLTASGTVRSSRFKSINSPLLDISHSLQTGLLHTVTRTRQSIGRTLRDSVHICDAVFKRVLPFSLAEYFDNAVAFAANARCEFVHSIIEARPIYPDHTRTRSVDAKPYAIGLASSVAPVSIAGHVIRVIWLPQYTVYLLLRHSEFHTINIPVARKRRWGRGGNEEDECQC
jgi:hypothetical protein